MINYEASAINSNVTLLQKMNKIEKYLLDNQLGNVFVTYQTLADDRLSDSDIQELNDRVIGKGDLLIDNDGYLYVITGFNEHTIYIDFAHRIKLGDRLDQDELDLIQQMIDNAFINLDPITITTNENGVLGNEEYLHTVAIGDSINLKDGTNPTAPSNSVFIGYDLGSTVQTGDTMYGESNVVIGDSSAVHGDQDIIIGRASSVTGYRSTAIGFNAVVNADNAVQLGTGSNSNDNTLQFKTTTIVDGNGNIAVKAGGTTGQVLAKNSALDYDYKWVNANADLQNEVPVIIGKDNVKSTTIYPQTAREIMIGYGNNILSNVTDFSNTVMIGNANEFSNVGNEVIKDNVAIGQTNYVEYQNNVAIGSLNKIQDPNGIEKSKDNISIGHQNNIYKNKNIAIGTDIKIGGNNNVTIGSFNLASTTPTGNYNVAIAGYGNIDNGTGNYNIRIGGYIDSTNYISGDYNVEITSHTNPLTNAQHEKAVIIGCDASVANGTSGACQIGEGYNSTTNSFNFRNTTIVDGNGKLNIPNGVNGTTGQVLTKLSNAENDYAWQTVQGGGSGKTFDIPMLINYTADESFSSIMNTPTIIVIDDQQTQQGLNLETSDPDFTDYEDKTSIYGYTYFTTGGDTKTQIVYGVIAESSTPGTYEFTGLMPLAPEITM